jgi:hypothetical protein
MIASDPNDMDDLGGHQRPSSERLAMQWHWHSHGTKPLALPTRRANAEPQAKHLITDDDAEA